MRAFKINNISFTVVAGLFSLIVTSCTCKEYLMEPPKVILTTDWTNRTEGIAIPSAYTVFINNQSLACKTVTNTLPELDAGTYPLVVYNPVDKITLSDNLAAAAVATSGDIVDAQPGYLFYSTLDIEFENDKEKVVTAVMQQQIRLLNIELTVTGGDIDNIGSVTASLSGVANGMDMKTETYSGTGLKVIPVFTPAGNKLVSSVRLIGMTAEDQKLALDITYRDGTNQQIVSDVSSLLTGFNRDKHKPLTLKGNAEIFSVAEIQTDITGWEVQDEISGDAEIH
jgi:hypothetical protein